MSNDAILARLDALETELKAKQQEIDALREQLKPTAATSPTETQTARTEAAGKPIIAAICGADNRQRLRDALNAPDDINGCLPQGSVVGGPNLRNLAAARFADVAAEPLFGRTGPTTGVQTTVTLGNSSEASITFGQTRFTRNAWRMESKDAPDGKSAITGFHPRTWSWSLGVRVPLDKGEGLIFKDKVRPERADFDIATNIRLRGEISFLQYDFVEADKRVDDLAKFLVKAHGDCLKDQVAKPDHLEFANRYAESPAPAAAPARLSSCKESELISWIIETTADPSLPTGLKFKRPELAAQYQSLFWSGTEKAPPKIGWGAAAEFGNRDFKFSQGLLSLQPVDNDPGQNELRLDPTQPLAKSKTDGFYSWKLELYGLVYKNLTPPKYDRLPAWDIPGVMFVPSVSYERQFAFRPGTTDKSICTLPAAGATPTLDDRAFLNCSTVNVDRPYRDNHFFGSAELRWRINNIPIVNSIGFAPKLSVRLDDGRFQADLPVWLQFDKDGKGTAGIRLRHYWGGRDLIGNPQRPETDLSFFFVPLTFSSF